VTQFFLDSQHAWLLTADPGDFMHSGALQRTTDGGRTWTSGPVPFGGGDLTFLDPSNGWMLADLGGGAGSNAVAVYQTRDGGANWRRVYVNDPNVEGAADSLPLGGLKSGLIPLDMQTAWIGGVVYAPGTVYLFRSDDAGRSWAPVTLDLPAGAENAELAFEEMQIVGPNEMVLAVRQTGAAYQLAIYVSTDGGDSWTRTPTLIPGGGSVDFVSPAEGVVWNGSQFYITRDAARTWTIVPPDVVFGETFAQMDFVSPDAGWVSTYDSSGRYTLYRTTDGARTWDPLAP
jgi:photosystem II stability/assembly factor-like uncharacterized protein